MKSLTFSCLICALSLYFAQSCPERQNFLEVARTAKSYSKLNCRAQLGKAFLYCTSICPFFLFCFVFFFFRRTLSHFYRPNGLLLGLRGWNNLANIFKTARHIRQKKPQFYFLAPCTGNTDFGIQKLDIFACGIGNPGKLCLLNLESLALESGIQLKKSGIPLTIRI